MKIRARYFGWALALIMGSALFGAQGFAQDAGGAADPVAGLEASAGLLTTYADTKKGRVLLRLPAPRGEEGESARFLYTEYLRAGLGSNPVGLDRSQVADSKLIRFRRVGARVFIEEMNTRYVASSNNPRERMAVRQSFASSILWGTDIAKEEDDGSLIIDISGFLTRDAHGVAQRLKQAGQGNFMLAADRSAVDAGATLVFPDNLEFEAILTFTSAEPGREVNATAPDGRAMTLRLHHSIVRLPDDGYRVREGDPRSGSITIPVYDYAADLTRPIIRQVALRHRLQKVDPAAARSPVKEPIVYYVDSGAPEPIRSALVEGASWWAEAFDAAGFEDAYRVEVLPDGAHPLDVRYNIVNWVHRQTRGWSYGSSVIDPRTGEIVKGNVLLGSLRVRQDRMIFEGLVGADNSGTGGPNDPVRVALSRIRQLAAHEVGHTLGFQHNMAASINNRASVMDYPGPKITLDASGAIDLGDAYAVGIGEWDKVLVAYLYSEAAPGENERAMLNGILASARQRGLHYVSDGHSRPVGSANPLGNLWDAGSDPVAELGNMMAVRRVALDNFGQSAIAAGNSMQSLQQVIVPIYLLHRYQVEAAAKSVGGLNFEYGVRGQPIENTKPVAAARQYQALNALLAALSPEALDLSDDVLGLMIPAPDGFDAQAQREIFKSPAHPAFSLLEAADVAADVVLNALLHPQRLSRIAEFSARDASLPSVGDIVGRLVEFVWRVPRGESARQGALRDVVKARVVSRLIEVSSGAPQGGPNIPGFTQDRGREALSSAAMAAVEAAMRDLLDRLDRRGASATDRMLASRIRAQLDRPAAPVAPQLGDPDTPPGSPIGSGWPETCWHC